MSKGQLRSLMLTLSDFQDCQQIQGEDPKTSGQSGGTLSINRELDLDERHRKNQVIEETAVKVRGQIITKRASEGC